MGLTEEKVIVCNEEGRLLGLPENRMGIRGTFIVLGRGEDGEFGNVCDPRSVIALFKGPEDAYEG